MNITLWSCREEVIPRGQLRPGFCAGVPETFTGPCVVLDQAPAPHVGAMLERLDEPGRFLVTGKFRWPGVSPGLPVIECCWLRAEDDIRMDVQPRSWAVHKPGYSLAWITLSDKGYAGAREDQAGPLIADLVGRTLSLTLAQGYLLPDDPRRLRALLVELALEQGIDLILTTGGTGVGPRDVTPETTLSVIEKRLPGMETAMLQAAQRKTVHAVISRAVAGTLGQSLIINLPGSPKAVRENLQALLPALDHTLAKLQGDPSDCAQAC